MANLTANYDGEDKDGELVAYNIGANVTVFKGALVAVADATGFLGKAGDTAGLMFAGVAFEGGDNRGGTAGAVGVRVKKTGSFIYAFSGTLDQTAVGKKCFAVDDHTVALAATTTNDIYVGDIVALVAEGKVRVRIDRAAG